jgi:hypothetical protein
VKTALASFNHLFHAVEYHPQRPSECCVPLPLLERHHPAQFLKFCHFNSTSANMDIATLTALTTFEAFPKLPFELRAEIWRLAIHDIPSQVVKTQPESPNPPATSRTCRESRLETLKAYTLVKGSRGNFFFDSAKDTLFINKTSSPDQDLQNMTPLHSAIRQLIPFLKPLRTLVLNLEDTKPLLPSVWPGFSIYEGHNLWALLEKWCPNLERIYLVTEYPPEPVVVAGSVEDRDQMSETETVRESLKMVEANLAQVIWQLDILHVQAEENSVQHDFYEAQLHHALNLRLSLIIEDEELLIERIKIENLQ